MHIIYGEVNLYSRLTSFWSLSRGLESHRS